MCYYILLLSKFENCQNIDKILSFFEITVQFSFEYVLHQYEDIVNI
jgi:hypothetical protein